jgi:hypothetical protein
MVEPSTPNFRDMEILPRRDSRITYWLENQPLQNFGDFLTEFLARALFRYPKVEADAFHLIGNVLDDALVQQDLSRTGGIRTGRAAFWCCGVRSEQGLTPPPSGPSVGRRR